MSWLSIPFCLDHSKGKDVCVHILLFSWYKNSAILHHPSIEKVRNCLKWGMNPCMTLLTVRKRESEWQYWPPGQYNPGNSIDCPDHSPSDSTDNQDDVVQVTVLTVRTIQSGWQYWPSGRYSPGDGTDRQDDTVRVTVLTVRTIQSGLQYWLSGRYSPGDSTDCQDD